MQLEIKDLNVKTYHDIWQQMKNFTDSRDENTRDEIWLVEHPPVFTLGQQAKKEHLLNPGDIPIIQTDRGGQVTYHGPGQLVLYPLIQLKRYDLGVRGLVTLLENLMIRLLDDYDIKAYARDDAPGVYVNSAKIGSIGLRVRRGASYHGLALNVAMDLRPFSRINPCGMSNLTMTQIQDFVPNINLSLVKQNIIVHLTQALGYNMALI